MKKRLIAIAIALFIITSTGSNPSIAECTKRKARSTPTTRFKINEGEAFDQKAQLTWCRCSAGSTWKPGIGCVGTPKLMNLEQARQFASTLSGGWRIPTIEELYSIVEQECSNPAINSEVFPDVRDLGEGAPYWSMTPVHEMPFLIYFIDFINGRVDGHSEGFAMAVRLVKSNR